MYRDLRIPQKIFFFFLTPFTVIISSLFLFLWGFFPMRHPTLIKRLLSREKTFTSKKYEGFREKDIHETPTLKPLSYSVANLLYRGQERGV